MQLDVKYWPVGPLVDVGGMVALPLAIRFAKLFLAHQRPRQLSYLSNDPKASFFVETDTGGTLAPPVRGRPKSRCAQICGSCTADNGCLQLLHSLP